MNKIRRAHKPEPAKHRQEPIDGSISVGPKSAPKSMNLYQRVQSSCLPTPIRKQLAIKYQSSAKHRHGPIDDTPAVPERNPPPNPQIAHKPAAHHPQSLNVPTEKIQPEIHNGSKHQQRKRNASEEAEKKNQNRKKAAPTKTGGRSGCVYNTEAPTQLSWRRLPLTKNGISRKALPPQRRHKNSAFPGQSGSEPTP
jgi:hypothetical protein